MTDPSRYWCEMAWLGADTPTSGVVIEIERSGGEAHITRVAPGVATPPADATRLDGLTVPAFANGHSHAFHRALRGRTHQPRGTFWTWRDLMYRAARRLTPESYRSLARAAFAEMALAGVGVVGEFHYLHHRGDGSSYDDPNAMGLALADAAAEAGVRLTLLDTAYLHGGFADSGAAESHRPVSPEQRRFDDGTADRWATRVDELHHAVHGGAVRVGAAIHSVRAVDPVSMEIVAAHTAGKEAPLHVHVSEQPVENDQCVARHGCSPIELLATHGVLGPATTVVHATHVSPPDIEHLATTGTGCCLCPTTERDLADGVGPSRALVEAGVTLSIGSDSHAVVDMLEEARAVELDERLVSLERGTHQPAALMAMATTNGYAAVGWPDGGRLVEGALADFTTIGLDSVRLAGTAPEHALAAAVFAGTAADVRHVVVAGRRIVGDGRHTTLDVATELAAAIEPVVAA